MVDTATVLPRGHISAQVSSSGGAGGPITYGMVARVAMSRPGFGFRIEHDLPVGVDLIEARPKATVVGDHLIWQFGRIDPGQEVRLEVVIQPQEGVVIRPEELAVFMATYSHNLFFEVPVVRPRLTARLTGPNSAPLGSSVEFGLEVANIGTWQADGVQAVTKLPPEFEGQEGAVITKELGTLMPGQLQHLTISAVAIARGNTKVHAQVTGPDDRQAVVEFPVEVS